MNERQKRIASLVEWCKERLEEGWFDNLIDEEIRMVIYRTGKRPTKQDAEGLMREINDGVVYNVKLEAQKRWVVSDSTGKDYGRVVVRAVYPTAVGRVNSRLVRSQRG